ncbi:hypothetical protein DITRI_Ditri17bG0119800 [Diplodiscus trichospermus]
MLPLTEKIRLRYSCIKWMTAISDQFLLEIQVGSDLQACLAVTEMIHIYTNLSVADFAKSNSFPVS